MGGRLCHQLICPNLFVPLIDVKEDQMYLR